MVSGKSAKWTLARRMPIRDGAAYRPPTSRQQPMKKTRDRGESALLLNWAFSRGVQHCANPSSNSKGDSTMFRRFATILAVLGSIDSSVQSASAGGPLGTLEATYSFHASALCDDPLRPYVYATVGSQLEIINTTTLAVATTVPRRETDLHDDVSGWQ